MPAIASAQEEGFTITESLRWQASKDLFPGHSILFFEGAVNHDSLGFLPVFCYSIPESRKGRVSQVIIEDGEYEPLIISNPSDYPDLDMISNEARIITETFISRKTGRQSIFLLPLRKAEGAGGYEKLVSFKLKVILDEHQANVPSRENAAISYADHSVLASGDWYRIGVSETGIHKITYSDLEGMGINPGSADPRQIRLFGNGDGMLDESNAIARTDDLKENTIYVAGEEDGQFDPEDYILFYGESPVSIRYNSFYLQFEHEINLYTDETYYFLTINAGQGKRIQSVEQDPGEPTHEIYTFQDLAYHEKEELNLIKSGKIWYGEVFNTQTEYNFPFDLAGIDVSEPVYLKVNLAGRTTTKTIFNIYANGSHLVELDVPSIVLGSQIYARPITTNFELFYTDNESVDIGIEFKKPGTIDMAWLNYIELNYIRHLRFQGGQLSFRDMRPVGSGHLARYHLQSADPGITIWEVSDPWSITSPQVSGEPGGVSFKYPAENRCEFIAFDGTQFFSPVFKEKVENQDLHATPAVDYIILTHPLFIDQAHRLADYHRQYNGLKVHLVTPQQIYNEFSSGAQDVSAIRDYMKMLYEKAPAGQEPRYLLLFGDASYDYKDYIPEDNNLVPTYESRESLKSAASFVTDDFFGCLDVDEGSNGSGTMDIGIGRFPVNSIEQAEALVNKTINYMSPARANFGPWRNSVCYIGDDEDNNTHLGQAEGLAMITDSLGTVYNVNKIYLDAYLQFQTPSGTRYPDVNAAIDKAVNDGCLIINYTGHGGEIAWADERVLDIPAIQSYKNITHLPAFVTATCEFSRYDDPGLVSAGELVFLNPDGAGIGLFTTTRLAFSQSNYALNKRFYYEAFNRDTLTGEYPRLGDLIMAAKTPSNQNIKNFVLLGDPALMLAYPKMNVRTLSITNEGIDRPADTISALSLVTVKGQVEDLQGNRMESFNGLVHTSVYDKPVTYRTRGNDPTSRITNFNIQDKILFKGEASVTAGLFSFTFVVPLDISYQFGEGKISYYALDTLNLLDAHGYDPVWIGGSDINATTDTEGPEIDIFLNTMTFSSGDITTPDPLLIVTLTDSSGINTVGNGIGHDITAIIDGNYQESIVLNDYFIPETDSYQKGEVRYRLGPFENGLHSITLKAWDVLNNSSEKTVEFQVNTGARLVVNQLRSLPNPFREGTAFSFEHNKPGSRLDVTIRIFNLTGQDVTALYYTVQNESNESGLLPWDGKDSAGNELSEGLYVYQLLVKSDDGYTSSLSQKLLHIR